MRFRYRFFAWTSLLVFCLGVLFTGLSSSAQEAPKKKNFAQKHPTMTSVAAGVAAYKVAKKTGQNRTAAGKKKNFAQRHPVLTGIGAAVATKHVIKKSNQKK